jgi:hypothetical protein
MIGPLMCSVDHSLVTGIARAGGGHAEFVVRNDLVYHAQ